MVLYSLVGLAVSVLSMRSESIPWILIAAAVALPLVLVATVCRRHIGLAR